MAENTEIIKNNKPEISIISGYNCKKCFNGDVLIMEVHELIFEIVDDLANNNYEFISKNIEKFMQCNLDSEDKINFSENIIKLIQDKIQLDKLKKDYDKNNYMQYIYIYI